MRRRLLIKADREFVIDKLDVVNGPTVGVHRPQHRHRFELCDIPHKHHSVTVEGDCAIVQSVNGSREHIRKLRCLILLYLYAAISCQQIGRAKRRWFAQTKKMLERVRGKDSDGTIGTGAVEPAL